MRRDPLVRQYQGILGYLSIACVFDAITFAQRTFGEKLCKSAICPALVRLQYGPGVQVLLTWEGRQRREMLLVCVHAVFRVLVNQQDQ